MNTQDFITELAKLRPSATFLTLKGYTNEHNEKADYQVVFHMSYASALKKSIDVLRQMSPTNELEQRAKEELLTSFHNSLTNNQVVPIEEREDHYTHFFTDDNKPVKGVKLHNETSTLHLYGLVVNKKVITPGNYPHKNQRPLTIAKDTLRCKTSVGKFRQFKITPQQVESIQVENLSLLPPNV